MAQVDAYLNSGDIANAGLATSVKSKLANAQAALARGNVIAAKNMLTAFIREVQAQRGKQITTAAADDLIASAQAILNQWPQQNLQQVLRAFLGFLTRGAP